MNFYVWNIVKKKQQKNESLGIICYFIDNR